ncbi:MAG: hypothetical protein PHO41_00065 [Eubacteriales bacterium]|nr:hypothetical protein [Eubacteriales bacterium]
MQNKLKRNNRQAKIIPFERDGEFFLRRGSDRLEKNDVLEAMSNYRQALLRDPENLDYQLAVAEVLTEMHRYEESNRMLLPLLSQDAPPSECYFGMACNFLGMQEFQHATDSLNSYLFVDPDGEFCYDAEDMLDAMESPEAYYDMPGVRSEEERKALRICERGRRCMEENRIHDAVNVLKQAAADWPDILFIKNNLSMAYFCAHDFANAVKTVSEVLEKDPENVQGHCNMLLFTFAAKKKEEAERELELLQRLQSDDPDDLNHMALVFMELNHFDMALTALKKMQSIFPYDEGMLHRMGVCNFRLGNYRQALYSYDTLLKIDPEDTIAKYYRVICARAVAGDVEEIGWLHHYQVPYAEVLRRVREINKLIKGSREDVRALWQQDGNFRSLLLWGLALPEPNAKRAILTLLAGLEDVKAERAMRDFLLDDDQPDSVKREVFAMLKQIGAKEPYVAILDGELVQSKVHITDFQAGQMPASYQNALDILLDSMEGTYGPDCIAKANDVFAEYIHGLRGEFPRLSPTQAVSLAAAVEYTACRRLGEDVTKTQIMNAYGISLVRLNNAISRVMRVLEQKKEPKTEE